MVVDREQEQFYTIGNDKRLKVTSLRYQRITAEFPLGNNKLACIGHDTKYKRLIVLNEIGEIFTFSIASKTPIPINRLSLENAKMVKGLSMNLEQDGFFVCIYLIIE
eukprot:TRINITY_DN6725_c0_g1_i17.p2 TRINITY_DN6725_c0_g1~~TRINITY_DN6725_c0_g1_i17.p2  ORF type:complete len:107 (+),score=11.39 TRINITY_DN6725_c0_g1_i17:284-604(+)